MFKNSQTTAVLFSALSTIFLLCFAAPSHAQQNAPQVDSFTLVDAATGEDITDYTNNAGVATGSVFISDVTNISLRFNTSNAGSVKISGDIEQTRTESALPYSLLGDQNGVYEPWSPSIGVHTIVVEPFAGPGASGSQGASAILTFTVNEAPISNPPSVDSFTLVNADTGADIANYTNNSGRATGSVSSTNAQRISLRFNTSNAGSVRISGVGASRTESAAPFSLLGDTIDSYTPWSPSPGVYTILVEPFSGTGTSGNQGESATLTFPVRSTTTPNPAPNPTSSITDAGRFMPAINYILLSDNEIADVPSSDVEDVCQAWNSTFPDGAVTVTADDRLNLQQLLDTHNVLRLSPGDYRSSGINQLTINSNQSIIALSPVMFPNVKVAAGATQVRLEGLRNIELSFNTGASIRYNCFKNLRDSSIVVDGATVERNLFVGFFNVGLNVDTAQRGHFSDNRFIKLNSHARDIPINIKGDAARRSGGNAFLLVDAQTPLGSGFSIDSQSDISFVGVDMEAYNARFHPSNTSPFALRVRNTGTFRAIKSSGMNRVSEDQSSSPGFDIDAERIFMTQFNAPTPEPVLRVGPSNDFLFSWRNRFSSDHIKDDSNNSALRVFAQESRGDEDPLGFNRIGSINDVSFSIGDTRLTSEPNAPIANPLRTALTQIEAGTASWSIPEFGDVPNPTGPDWNANLDQRVDESTAIQAMINANGIAHLEPRTYYVGSSILLDRNQGIIGAGANKTAIIALRPDIDIVDLVWTDVPRCEGIAGGFTLAELTLQGGRNGVLTRQPGAQVNRSTISHVTFRNMANAGILVDGVFGWDNNLLDHVNFVDSAYGFRQLGGENPGNSCYGEVPGVGVLGEFATMSYMDKTVFYRNQFLGLGTAIELMPVRQNNLNGIVESLFKDSTSNAINLSGGNKGLMIASSSFIDNAGNPMLNGSIDTTVVNSFFEAGQGRSMLNANVTVEGSTFVAGSSTNATVFYQPRLIEVRNPRFFDVYNSVLEIPLGPVDSTVPIAGMYFNNDRLIGDSLNEFFNVIEYVTNLETNRDNHPSPNVLNILRGTSSPGSQLLRGGSWEP